MSINDYILCIGDIHIPDRAIEIPEKFRELFSNRTINHIICLGNLNDSATYEYLKSITPNIQMVPGPYDLQSFGPADLSLSTRNSPKAHSGVVQHGNLRIGFVNGSAIVPPGDPESLMIAARQMDVNVLLWGGTHKFEAFRIDDNYFINPGSATGAFSTAQWADGEEPVPSFVLLKVQGSVLTGYRYSIKKDANGEEKVDKSYFRFPPETELAHPNGDEPSN